MRTLAPVGIASGPAPTRRPPMYEPFWLPRSRRKMPRSDDQITRCWRETFGSERTTSFSGARPIRSPSGGTVYRVPFMTATAWIIAMQLRPFSRAPAPFPSPVSVSSPVRPRGRYREGAGQPGPLRLRVPAQMIALAHTVSRGFTQNGHLTDSDRHRNVIERAPARAALISGDAQRPRFPSDALRPRCGSLAPG